MTNGLVAMTPTSVSYSGTSASINANGSVVFSAVTEFNLNGVFTGDYDNYMVFMRAEATSPINTYIRFRQSGTDNPNSTHVYQYLQANSTSVNAGRATSTGGLFSSGGNSLMSGVTGYIFGPYLAQPTAHASKSGSSENGSRVFDCAGTESSSTQWDGFKIVTTAYAFSGIITVFGFNQ